MPVIVFTKAMHNEGMSVLVQFIKMASSQYGHKRNPYHRQQDLLVVNGVQQYVVITNNFNRIDQLLVWLPNLSTQDVIIPGMTCLPFTIDLNSTNANRTVVQNLSWAVMKKTTIKISWSEFMLIDNSNIYKCYIDLFWTLRGTSCILQSTGLVYSY